MASTIESCTKITCCNIMSEPLKPCIPTKALPLTDKTSLQKYNKYSHNYGNPPL